MSRRSAFVLAFAALGVALLASSGATVASRPTASPLRASHHRHWHPRFDAAKRYAQSRAGDVRFAIIGLGNGYQAFNGGRSAPMASLYKAMALAAYLHRVRDRHLLPWERHLLKPMIRRSDNDAATTIDEILGRGPIERLAHRAGMRQFQWNDAWGLSRTSAGDQARFFHHYRRFIPKRHEYYAMKLLGSIVRSQRWGIAEVRPRGWHLYFKGGWGFGTGLVDHQSALLERRGRRIGLSIITENQPNHAYGMQSEQGVAGRLLKGLPRIR
jgi:hypothetical protein